MVHPSNGRMVVQTNFHRAPILLIKVPQPQNVFDGNRSPTISLLHILIWVNTSFHNEPLCSVKNPTTPALNSSHSLLTWVWSYFSSKVILDLRRPREDIFLPWVFTLFTCGIKNVKQKSTLWNEYEEVHLFKLTQQKILIKFWLLPADSYNLTVNSQSVNFYTCKCTCTNVHVGRGICAKIKTEQCFDNSLIYAL